ncbi:MAG: hypothetical protein R3F59_02200 [Myxococcota bacterium]
MWLWALGACGGSAPEHSEAAAAAPEEPGGVIVMVSERVNGEGERVPAVWAVRPDGTHRVPIGRELPGAVFPGPIDPKGTHVLLVSSEDGKRGHVEQLWLGPLRGGPVRPLLPPSKFVRNPAWADGGDAVVAESDAQSFRDLYRAERAGGPPKRITDQPNGSFEPDAGPDGRIVFGASRDGNAEIYVMQGDGTQPVRLTDAPGDDLKPHWSPDGTRIAWIAHRNGVARVWTMAPDGSHPQPVREKASGNDIDLAWSPDGKRLAIVVQEGQAQGEIVVVEADTGAEVGRLDGPAMDEHPAWSPDGQWIAWTESHGENANVAIARPTGEDRRTVSAGGVSEWLPRWIEPAPAEH